jgi:hypothetical protein
MNSIHACAEASSRLPPNFRVGTSPLTLDRHMGEAQEEDLLQAHLPEVIDPSGLAFAFGFLGLAFGFFGFAAAFGFFGLAFALGFFRFAFGFFGLASASAF